MTTSKTNKSYANRWLLAAILGLLLYGFAQPYLDSQLGIKLPSLAQLVGEDQSTTSDATTAGPDDAANDAATKASSAEDTIPASKLDPSVVQTSKPSSSKTNDAKISDASRTSPNGDSDVETRDEEATELDPLTEYLKETPAGSENYVSPEGLRYTRGSEEGHRIKHLQRHLADQPKRPGKHGVFSGDLLQVLRWLDDAYVRGKERAKGTTQLTEDGRTVYDVSFDQVVGFVGGQTGKREGNPQSKRIRLVVDRDRVITAYPF